MIGDLTRIPVIRGNNQQSELTSHVRFNTVTGSGPSAANIDRQDFSGIDVFTSPSLFGEFSPDQQSVSYIFELRDDLEVEQREVFQVELSLVESGLNIDVGGPLAMAVLSLLLHRFSLLMMMVSWYAVSIWSHVLMK